MRWVSTDPQRDRFPSWSPFAYSFGNPLRFLDPRGEEPRDFAKLSPGELASLAEEYRNRINEGMALLGDLEELETVGTRVRSVGTGLGQLDTVLPEANDLAKHLENNFPSTLDYRGNETNVYRQLANDLGEEARRAEQIRDVVGSTVSAMTSGDRVANDALNQSRLSAQMELGQLLRRGSATVTESAKGSLLGRVGKKVGKFMKGVGGKLLKGGTKMLPFIGWAAGLYSMRQNLQKGNYGAAFLDAVGLVPIVGDVVDAVRLSAEIGVSVIVDKFMELKKVRPVYWYPWNPPI